MPSLNINFQCRFCQLAISEARWKAQGFCESLACRQQYNHSIGTQVTRKNELQRDVLEAELRVRAAAELEVAEEELYIVQVPYNSHSTTALGYEVIEAFQAHLQALVESYEGETEAEHVSEYEPPTGIEHLDEVLTAACTGCRGHCCLNGREYHAFIDHSTIARILELEPEIGVDGIVEFYSALIPAVAVQNGCIFQSDEGCVLPSSYRADICNDYFCEGLRQLIDEHEREEPEHAILAIWDDECLINTVNLTC
ncbi:hypothetical protein EDC56_0998 [Sinobacterium caligoides]|uniref:Uncharacterized protein n=1 Tax=Sinobacterium caligoides TaxID=933926 RepID=A0A3N2E058_9GAMM|nr:hypothetical protein [Sinobacterium caligoides]ROS05468.1 hypothetical protein EDC56_0998 [Sinobacterium caligoides]